MKKIRINELARDLEIKANLILDLLPELGVTEKKTHSSSIDEDVAEKLRLRFAGSDYVPRSNGSGAGSALDEPEFEEHEQEDEREEEAISAERTPAALEEPSETLTPAEEAQVPAHEAPPEPVVARPVPRMPIRPPLGPRPMPQAPAPAPPASAAPAAPPIQADQPVAPPVQAMPGPAPPRPMPSAPSRPAAPPVRPLPQARPGQVLSGPRAPFPGGLSTPSAPPGTPISRPSPGMRQSPPPQRTAPPQRPISRPQGPVLIRQAAPGSPRPANAPLAGQPAARPVVPPRPDLERRIRAAAPPAAATPGTPAPRPPQQSRPPASPVPGQPIYRGPIRPGQPIVARGPDNRGPVSPQRPGLPPQRPGGPRPMHPVSRPGMIAPGTAPPAPEQQRRPGDNRRRTAKDRQFDHEEKVLRPTRRETPSGPPPISREITISEGITVKELSEKLDVKANFVIKKLVDRGIFATINQTLDATMATTLAREFGASTATVSFEEESRQEVEEAQVEKDQLKRAPVVTIMGHVDHGKTSLLDAIRHANVAEKEAGGITQHIGAYQVEQSGRKIVFIDTPGHEAFTRMRSRGAKVTDIVILVVAADDGVMPQTLEAIDHAKAAKVPIIVAINKIDKPNAQPDRIKQQLSDRGLLAEDWGGDTVMVPLSAKTKENLDLLLEMVILVADLQDLRANPERPAMGSVLEAKLDRGRGPVATVLVRNGTLHVGDFFICGSVFGKVRALISDRGEPIREAEPSTPVEVLGLDTIPDAGDSFQVVTDTAKAKQIVMYRESKAREVAMAKNGPTDARTVPQTDGSRRSQGAAHHSEGGRWRLGRSPDRYPEQAFHREDPGSGLALGRRRYK